VTANINVLEAYILTVITQFRFATARNCEVSTRCIHELQLRSSSRRKAQCFVSVYLANMWLLILFWCGCMKRSMLYKWDGYGLSICACYSCVTAFNVALDISFVTT
jgi:hypothetical protein